MYKAPDSVNAKSTASARLAYVKIHPNGQVIFGSAFIAHNFVSDKEGENTYFNFQYISSSKTIIVAFANEDEILGQVENLSTYTDAQWEKGVQCLEDGGILWRFTGGDLKKGLTGTIRSINKGLLPKKGYITRWIEDIDLTIHLEEKYVELACKGKKPEPNSATEAILKKEAEAKAISKEEEEVTTEMQESYLQNDEETFLNFMSERGREWRPYLDKFLEWAESHEEGKAKVKALKESFKEDFASAVRTYNTPIKDEFLHESETSGVKVSDVLRVSATDATDTEESPA